MDAQLLSALEYLLNAVTSFAVLHFKAILATLILLLGYRLVRVGLERVPTSSTATQELRRYAWLIGPGAALSLIGALILAGEDPLLVALFLLTLSTVAGLVLIGIGYKLFVSGVYEADDATTIWDDSTRLIGRAAPGLLLIIFGVIVTSSAVWSGPDRIREYSEARRESTQQIVEMVDAQLSEALTLLQDYLESGE